MFFVLTTIKLGYFKRKQSKKFKFLNQKILALKILMPTLRSDKIWTTRKVQGSFKKSGRPSSKRIK